MKMTQKSFLDRDETSLHSFSFRLHEKNGEKRYYYFSKKKEIILEFNTSLWLARLSRVLRRKKCGNKEGKSFCFFVLFFGSYFCESFMLLRKENKAQQIKNFEEVELLVCWRICRCLQVKVMKFFFWFFAVLHRYKKN